MSGVGSSTSSGIPSSFEIFVPAERLGLKSATAAAMTTTSAPSAAAPTACSMSAAVSTSIRVIAPATSGGRASGDDVTSVTAAPRRAAATGDGMALLPRRAVRDETDGVERFPRAARAARPPVAAEQVPRPRRPAEPFEHTLDDDGRVGQPALSRVAAGQPPALGRDDLDAAALERGQVVPHRRVLPHLGVHGGAHDHGRPGGQQRGAQEVVGEPGGVAGDGVGGGGHDEDEVGALAELRVRNGRRLVPQRALDRLGGQRREGDVTDEPRGVLGQHRR